MSMRQIRTLGLATVLAAGVASTCFAVTGRDAAGNPNGAPPETLSQAPSQQATGQTGPDANHPVGTTVGPGSGNHETQLGYGKGSGENSQVGK